jgi:hypothetical protein
MNYVWSVGRALSRLLNACLGGDDRDTTSARIGHLIRYSSDHWVARLPWPRALRKHFLASA